jgi:hypothetical protein
VWEGLDFDRFPSAVIGMRSCLRGRRRDLTVKFLTATIFFYQCGDPLLNLRLVVVETLF